mmetsp:Transcript_43030/g.102161  ORF Transcript_43030/g.102161 Transcript_43030/m.102161 type:complete len:91 (-) Transcript_43030:95-367(-)
MTGTGQQGAVAGGLEGAREGGSPRLLPIEAVQGGMRPRRCSVFGATAAPGRGPSGTESAQEGLEGDPNALPPVTPWRRPCARGFVACAGC